MAFAAAALPAVAAAGPPGTGRAAYACAAAGRPATSSSSHTLPERTRAARIRSTVESFQALPSNDSLPPLAFCSTWAAWTVRRVAACLGVGEGRAGMGWDGMG